MKTFNIIRRFLNGEAGLESIEYAIIAALITASGIAAIAALSGKVADRFNALVTLIT
jgi:Flp pilus assembly pilin Flp